MERLDRIEKLIEELVISQQEIDSKFKEQEELCIKNDSTQAHYDSEFDKIGQELRDIGLSNGDSLENFFYKSLNTNKTLGVVKFNEITRNLKPIKPGLSEKFTFFLENDNAVSIIDVHYIVNINHIENLLNKKLKNFRILAPYYANYKLYLGIAGLSFENHVEEYATENGIAILKQNGDLVQMNASGMKAF